jgi:DNA-binding ferritin-like protein
MADRSSGSTPSFSPHFIGVHETLDPQYGAVGQMVAERMAALGDSPITRPGAIVAHLEATDGHHVHEHARA